MNFFSELKRRNVYKVAVAYAVVGWLLVQIVTQTFPFFEIPNWAVRLVILLVVIGFPVALIIAWAFELTPEGLKRTESAADVPRRPAGGRTWIYLVIAGCLLSLGLFFLGRFTAAPTATTEGATSARAPAARADASLPEKSIAVLPFENRSHDPENAYFADGIQDEILTRLAKIGDLKVISRTSTQKYKSAPGNLKEIALQLGVANILEGSVQKSGDQVRVTVQLIRATTDSHLWAETYDRKLTDIFAVESEIAETIARSLQARLTPGEQQAVALKPTENPAAYEAYLRGLALWNQLSNAPEVLEEIDTYFSRAVELDPKFALGWSFLSIAHSFNYNEFDPTPQRAARAKEALDRALSLQPDLGQAYFAQGMYRYKVLREYEKALESFQKARERSANRTMAIEFSSYVKRRQGKWDEALRLHAESIELDPRNPLILSEAALSYRALRRFDEAHELVDRAREIEPQSGQLLTQKAEISLAQGDPVTADRLLKQVPVDERDPLVAASCVRFWMILRQYPEAIRTLKKVIEKPENFPGKFATIAANYRAELAIAEALAASPMEARAALERARDELTSVRSQGSQTNWNATMLLLVSGFLKDKVTLDGVAAQLRDKIQNDAVTGPSLEAAIAIARAHLGETDAALKSIKELLQKPGEGSLTPALLRADPLWDPLRNEPRFRELAETKP